MKNEENEIITKLKEKFKDDVSFLLMIKNGNIRCDNITTYSDNYFVIDTGYFFTIESHIKNCYIRYEDVLGVSDLK